MRLDIETTKLAERYAKYSAPVQWVEWWGDSNDPVLKQQLEDILFESDSGTLRDLTQPYIREQITALVINSDALLRLVWAEMRPALEDFVNRGDEGESTPS